MAELGIIASILQISDVGLRLSLKLYTFGETVVNADKAVVLLSKDISLTSSVLQELGQHLRNDCDIASENAIKTAKEIVEECLQVFQELDAALEKSKAKMDIDGKGKGKWTSAVIEKVRWPFQQPKIEQVGGRLDKLRATLMLMLNVIIYARQLSEKKRIDPQLESQRKLIEDLSRLKDEYIKKLELITMPLEAPNLTSSPAKLLGPFHHMQEGNGSLEELTYYSRLMNKLICETESRDYEIDDMVRSRIIDDIINAYKRESAHFVSLHGPEIQKVFTGRARDLASENNADGAVAFTYPCGGGGMKGDSPGNFPPSSILYDDLRSPSPKANVSLPSSGSPMAALPSSGSSMAESMDSSQECVTEPIDWTFEVHEQDCQLPLAQVARVMRAAIPEHAALAGDAKELMQECVTEFISFVTSEAAERCAVERRKRIEGYDILAAFRTLGFEHYAQALRVYIAGYRGEQSGKVFDQPPDVSKSEEHGNVAAVFPDFNLPGPQRGSKMSAAIAVDNYHDRPSSPIEMPAASSQNVSASNTSGQFTNIVDDLLAQWTTVRDK